MAIRPVIAIISEYSLVTMFRTYAIDGTARKNLENDSYFPQLSNFFNENGWQEVKIEEAQIYIGINHNPRSYKIFRAAGGQIKNSILMRLEPPAVLPSQFKRRVEKLYGLVITPGATSTRAESQVIFRWPYVYSANPASPKVGEPTLASILSQADFYDRFDLDVWEHKKSTAVLIAANKVSPTSDSNYGTRRSLAHVLSLKVLEIYGPLWNESIGRKLRHRLGVFKNALANRTFPNLFSVYGNLFTKYTNVQGVVDDKHLVNSLFKYSLVVENSNSYVSEKLIDAMISGSIPLYIGPDLELTGFPKGIAVEITGWTEKQISELIDNMSLDQASEILVRIKEFLQSEVFIDGWDSNKVYSDIGRYILSHVGNES